MLLCVIMFESEGSCWYWLEFVTLQVPTNPDLRLLVYTANPATLTKLNVLLAADQRGQAQELYAGGR